MATPKPTPSEAAKKVAKNKVVKDWSTSPGQVKFLKDLEEANKKSAVPLPNRKKPTSKFVIPASPTH
jgi:hypothetical protein